jgi:malate dehydrogenase (quinone)
MIHKRGFFYCKAEYMMGTNRVFCLLLVVISACKQHPPSSNTPPIDAILIGGGIMSATLASMLRELDPDMSIEIYEKLEKVAQESSSAWNNAGTGHQSYSELNYTPELPDGTIDITKAIEISEAFEVSKQFWAYQVEKKNIFSPRSFVNRVPHMSFVWGDDNVAFLKKRYEALIKHPLFFGMEYSEDRQQIEKWIPLVMEGRNPALKIAATRMMGGVDVDFGALTKLLIDNVMKSKNSKLFLSYEVIDLVKNTDATWTVVSKNLKTNKEISVKAKFVFIGAGGGSLPLLQRSQIPQAKGLGGFPVGGAWLVTDKPELIERHFAKVYGKASTGSPPMSVPHLDTRFIDGKKALLFGPFATYSTKFLKDGSWLDLPMSVNFSNIIPMLEAGFHNFDLVRYLIGQVLMTKNQRLASLQEYVPHARLEDWQPKIAGQRVQVIKKDSDKGGILQFGTELVSSSDGSLVALLGASPGASIAVKIMLDVLKTSFKEQLKTSQWQTTLKKMIPSYGQKLSESPSLLKDIRAHSNKLLLLEQ